MQRHYPAATQMGTTHCVTLSGARKRAVERVSVGPAELKNKTISIKVELNQHTFTRSEAFARVFEEFIRVTGGDPFDYIISNLQNQTIHLAKPTFNTFSSAQDDGKGLSPFPSHRSKPSQETLKHSVKSSY